MATLSDEMTRILEEAAEGLQALEDEVITTGFDPDDPASVEAAIRHINERIDAKVVRWDEGAGAATSSAAWCVASVIRRPPVAPSKLGGRARRR